MVVTAVAPGCGIMAICGIRLAGTSKSGIFGCHVSIMLSIMVTRVVWLSGKWAFIGRSHGRWVFELSLFEYRPERRGYCPYIVPGEYKTVYICYHFVLGVW